jgi:integrase
MEGKMRMHTQLTPDQLQRLQETLQGHPLEAIITLALVTGMRRDELLRLQWQDIDLEQGEVRVHSTKTKSDARILPVSPVGIEMLKQHRQLQLEAQQKDDTAKADLDLVFPDHTGGVFRPDHLVKEWYELLNRAALPPISFHSLRLTRGRTLRERLRLAKEGRDGPRVEEA